LLGAVDYGAERATRARGVSPGQPADSGPADPQDAPLGRPGQLPSPEVRKQVSETVDQ